MQFKQYRINFIIQLTLTETVSTEKDMWKKDNTASGLVNNLIQNFESTLIYKNDERTQRYQQLFKVTQVLNLGADCFIRYRVAQKRCCHTELYFWLKNILYAIRIGRFRVPKTLTFKMRLGAQPFLWKWVLFAWELKKVSISKVEHQPSFETEAQGNSEKAY